MKKEKQKRCDLCGSKCYETLDGGLFCHNHGLVKDEKQIEDELMRDILDK